ncbi:MAG TPA: DNA-binding response regulator [Lachnospiraceae bacterium]|nr:DNA-binding response regulator [Lachnospiraceae bacterium]
MYRFAVCDDNPADADYVAGLIGEWNKTAGLPLKIEQYPSAEAFLFAYGDDNSFDVLFLDIEMGNMSGVELAKRLRQAGAGLQIIFITGYMEYIAEGYDVEALHYLIKPVTGGKLGAVLDRAVERLKIRENTLTLALADGVVRLSLYEIRYLEVQKNYVTIHAGDEYSVKRTLNELEEELDESFYRIHRSYIVNLRFVKRISRAEVILKDGTALPLSRKLYDGLNQAVIRYF